MAAASVQTKLHLPTACRWWDGHGGSPGARWPTWPLKKTESRPPPPAYLTFPPVEGSSVRVLDGLIDLIIGMAPVNGEPTCTLGSSSPPPIGPPSASYRAVLAEGMAEMDLLPTEAERHLLDLDRTR